jgi:CBS-domain-containing membrane protein
MLAEKIMVTNLVTATQDELISEVIIRMHKAKLRMLPVLDAEKHVVGVVSTHCVLSHIVPDYLISGDLTEISFAPDMGILRKQYAKASTKTVGEVMSDKPLTVGHTDSIISVAAHLASHDCHEYALVVDDQEHLVGVISAGDILDALEERASEVSDA